MNRIPYPPLRQHDEQFPARRPSEVNPFGGHQEPSVFQRGDVPRAPLEAPPSRAATRRSPSRAPPVPAPATTGLVLPLRCRDVSAGSTTSLSPTALMIFLRLACVGLPVSESIRCNACRYIPACWATAGIRRASATSRRANRNRLSECSAAAFKYSAAFLGSIKSFSKRSRTWLAPLDSGCFVICK